MIDRLSIILFFLMISLPTLAQEGSDTDVAKHIKSLYPKTQFQDIRQSDIPGVYEVVMGKNIAYTDRTGRYFIFGHLFDMKSQVDLTAQRKLETLKIEFPAKLLGNAIKTVKGEGSRVVAVFSDPDCGHCKSLEAELSKLDDITIYTFLYPMEQRHPESKTRSIAIWCSPDRSKAWIDYMLTGKLPPFKACNNPINDNLVLGSRLGVVGTPTLISEDGRVLPGTTSGASIDKWLAVQVTKKDMEIGQ